VNELDAARAPTLVLGIGSVLMGDDWAGPHVVALIAAGFRLPDGVELLDAGTVRAEGTAGTVRVYTEEEILRHPGELRRGQHEPALRDTLLSLALSGEGPEEVVLVGVVPHEVLTRVGLSPAAKASAPLAAAEVVRRLGALGAPVEARQPPAKPDIWWERAEIGEAT
jgi:hydrogenase maturation protease